MCGHYLIYRFSQLRDRLGVLCIICVVFSVRILCRIQLFEQENRVFVSGCVGRCCVAHMLLVLVRLMMMMMMGSVHCVYGVCVSQSARVLFVEVKDAGHPHALTRPPEFKNGKYRAHYSVEHTRGAIANLPSCVVFIADAVVAYTQTFVANCHQADKHTRGGSGGGGGGRGAQDDGEERMCREVVQIFGHCNDTVDNSTPGTRGDNGPKRAHNRHSTPHRVRAYV